MFDFVQEHNSDCPGQMRMRGLLVSWSARETVGQQEDHYRAVPWSRAPISSGASKVPCTATIPVYLSKDHPCSVITSGRSLQRPSRSTNFISRLVLTVLHARHPLFWTPASRSLFIPSQYCVLHVCLQQRKDLGSGEFCILRSMTASGLRYYLRPSSKTRTCSDGNACRLSVSSCLGAVERGHDWPRGLDGTLRIAALALLQASWAVPEHPTAVGRPVN